MIVRDTVSPIQRASRHFATVTGLVTLLLLVFVGHAVVEAARKHTGGSVDFILRTLFLLPGLFYLWSLFALRALFREVAFGSLFGPAMSRGLSQVGLALLGSGLTSTIVVPALAVSFSWLRPVNPNTPPSDYLLRVDAAYLMLALIGIALVAVARLFAMAREYRAENAALRSELEEFL